MSAPSDASATEVVPEGKLRCFITGNLRERTPEEKNRQTVARRLVEEYDYPKDTLELEFPIKMGRKTKRADIVAFPPDKDHSQENIDLIVEVKPEEIKPTNSESGVKQLESYVSASMNCQFAMWVGSERLTYKIDDESGDRVLNEIPDIPRFGEDTLPRPVLDDLKPAVSLDSTFSRIHNFIYANQGLQKDKAFEELLKIIFVKVYDERYPPLDFYILPEENIDETRRRIENIFNDVKLKYDIIFDSGETIELNNKVLSYLVSELQRFSFLDTETDVKGKAYEELVGPNLRGDRGEFFTPRNVCDMTVDMVFSLFDEDKLLKPGNVKILDPAVGTGGFPVSMIHQFEERYESRGILADRVQENIQDVAKNSLYGIDFNPFLVKVAQMNMVMHGDGYSNVVQANSLKSPSNWNTNAQDTVGLGEFEVVITNPPFGTNARIDDIDILSQYDLTTYGTGTARKSLPPEQLFIERCLQFLKPEGVLGIVLPDSILSNPGLEWIRDWLLENVQLVASVDLPVETFEPHTGTQTSVLIMRKKDPNKNYDDDYDVLMASPDKVGNDRRGNTVYRRDGSGVQVDSKGDPIIADDLPNVSEKFKNWCKDRGMIQ